MPTCARCGAMNPLGKAACWKCWAPLAPAAPAPPPDPELAAPVRRKQHTLGLRVTLPSRRARPPEEGAPLPSFDDAPSPAQSDLATSARETAPDAIAAAPAPVDREPEPDSAPAEALATDLLPAYAGADPREGADPAASDTPAPEPPVSAAPVRREFAYIADRANNARRVGSLLGILLALGLVLGVLAFYWYATARARPLLTTPEQVATQYLFNLAARDRLAAQQLASRDSRGQVIAPWLIITDGRPAGAIAIRDHTAIGKAHVTLAPVREAHASTSLVAATSRAYTVPLHLVKDVDGWRVDQRAFFTDLRHQIVVENPGLTLPPWPGLAE